MAQEAYKLFSIDAMTSEKKNCAIKFLNFLDSCNVSPSVKLLDENIAMEIKEPLGAYVAVMSRTRGFYRFEKFKDLRS